jgi:uncharacterized lipoprotein YajG
MSNKHLCILAAILIIAAIFAERSHVCNVGGRTVADTQQVSDSVKISYIINSYNQRIARTVRCLVSAGTPPSLITRQVNKLYEERERAIREQKASRKTK